MNDNSTNNTGAMDTEGVDAKELEQMDRIDDYLRGRLSPEEEKALEAELRQNPAMRQMAVAAAKAAKAMEAVGRVKDARVAESMKSATQEQLDKVLGKTSKTSAESSEATSASIGSAQNGKGHSPLLVPLLLIAACSLAILVPHTMRHLAVMDCNELADSYADAFVVAGGLTGETRGDSPDEDVLKALTDNADNIAALQEMWAQAKGDTYCAYTDFATEIGWSLALAQLREGDKDAAIATLEELAALADEGSAVQAKCQELIMKIREL